MKSMVKSYRIPTPIKHPGYANDKNAYVKQMVKKLVSLFSSLLRLHFDINFVIEIMLSNLSSKNSK